MKFEPNHIVITGASSGIGEALAHAYAAPGIMLSLTGRDEQRLKDVVAICEGSGAVVYSAIVDVVDQEAMETVMGNFFDRQPIDLVIANAGISAGTGDNGHIESSEQIREIFDVNLTGVLNTIDPVLPKMLKVGRGQIALMSSMAGFYGFAGAPAYCASKAAVRIYGESLRTSLAGTGVFVNVICPGFVQSRITDVNNFFMPFLMCAPRAAKIIKRGLKNNNKITIFPILTYLLVRLIMACPSFLAEWLVVHMLPAKSSRN